MSNRLKYALKAVGFTMTLLLIIVAFVGVAAIITNPWVTGLWLLLGFSFIAGGIVYALY